MNTPTTNKAIRVLLVDDHPIVKSGVRSELSNAKGIELVGAASTGSQALRMARQLQPDVVLMDISIPAPDGLEVTKRLHEALPKIKVMAFTMHENKEYVLEVLRQGGRGYVLKNSSAAELCRAIRLVQEGNRYFSPQISKLLLNQLAEQVETGKEVQELSSREKAIVALIASAMSTKEIARRLNVSTRTVDVHRASIMKKLNIHSAAGLTRYAIENGIA